MKNMIRTLTAMLLALVLMLSVSSVALATPSRGNLVHFVPTIITVETEKVKVEGYFINLNEDCSVKNFREYEMEVYMKGDLLISGEFGTINEFTVKPMGAKYQSFTFNGEHDLNEGTYDCDDTFYCVVNCTFTSVDN